MSTSKGDTGRQRARTQHGSFRMLAAVAERLDARSEELGVSRNHLLERYVDEGLRRDKHPLVYFREAASGRRPALLGTRLDVWQVIETVRAESGSVAAAAGYLGQPEAKVAAAVSYYAEFKEEIDAFAERAKQAAEEAETAWRREREAFRS